MTSGRSRVGSSHTFTSSRSGATASTQASKDAGILPIQPCSQTAPSSTSPVPLIGYSGLPLPVRALSAIGCGLSVLLGGPFLIAQAMDGRLFRGRERAS